jgi:hypothetical protein
LTLRSFQILFADGQAEQDDETTKVTFAMKDYLPFSNDQSYVSTLLKSAARRVKGISGKLLGLPGF